MALAQDSSCQFPISDPYPDQLALTPSMPTPYASPTLNLHYQLAACEACSRLALRLLCVFHVCWSVHPHLSCAQ